MSDLVIDGVEVTQSIQYYHAAEHLSDPADRGPDNSLRLIANKPAWVRVYLRCRLVSHTPGVIQIPGVTGTVEVQRLSVVDQILATHMPQPPGTVTAQSLTTYVAQRKNLSASLNFIIPADEMCGALRLIIRVTAPGGYSSETTVDLDVSLRQTLNLVGIMVNYKGPDGTKLPAPTIADLEATSALTLLMYPVQSQATYRTAGTVDLTFPLTDSPDGNTCTPKWRQLGALLKVLKLADGNRPDVVYYGLLPEATPVGPVTGCDAGGVSIARTAQQGTMAHEIGHQCGFMHAPCGSPPNPDPNYPAYEPYDPVGTPRASIGEYGLDVSTGDIYVPQTTKDYMSYCGKPPTYPPPWMSLYHYGKLIENPILSPEIVCRAKDPRDPLYEPEIPWYEWRQRVISIIGTVHANGDLEVSHVARVETVPDVSGGSSSEMTAQLLGGDGKLLASAAVHLLASHGHGGGCSGCSETGEARPPYNVQAYVPDAARGSALRIVRGDEEIWSAKAREQEPRVRTFSARVEHRTFLRADWEVEFAGGVEPDFWLRWSADGGKTWYALATGLKGRSARPDLSRIRSGKVMVQLLAHDGFETGVSKSVALTVPRRSPEVAVLRPRAGAVVLEGRPLCLWAAATSCTGEPVAAKAYRWLIDGKEVAHGRNAWVAAPKAGRHTCSLVVQDGKEKATQTISLETVSIRKNARTDARSVS